MSVVIRVPSGSAFPYSKSLLGVANVRVSVLPYRLRGFSVGPMVTRSRTRAIVLESAHQGAGRYQWIRSSL